MVNGFLKSPRLQVKPEVDNSLADLTAPLKRAMESSSLKEFCLCEETMVSKKNFFIIMLFTTCFFLAIANTAEAGNLVPLNLFNIGDSIGEGEAADGTIGEVQH